VKVKYFPDTDTALLEFNENVIVETRALSEDVCIDVDRDGKVVSITVEHARTNARLPELTYQDMGPGS
jgi:uncharacterized protein YuzE